MAYPTRRPLSRSENYSFSEGLFDPSAQSISYILANVSPDDLHSALSRAFTTVPLSFSQRQIDVLLETIQAAGILPTVATAQLAVGDDNLRHCVRCHQAYYERFNGRTACFIGQEYPRVVMDRIICSPNGELVAVPHHFLGRHTTMSQLVLYNHNNIQKCEESSDCPNYRNASLPGSTGPSSGSSTPADCTTSEFGARLDTVMAEVETEPADSESSESSEDEEYDFYGNIGIGFHLTDNF